MHSLGSLRRGVCPSVVVCVSPALKIFLTGRTQDWNVAPRSTILRLRQGDQRQARWPGRNDQARSVSWSALTQWRRYSCLIRIWNHLPRSWFCRKCAIVVRKGERECAVWRSDRAVIPAKPTRCTRSVWMSDHSNFVHLEEQMPIAAVTSSRRNDKASR